MPCSYDDILRACNPPAGALKTIQFFDPATLSSQPVWYDLPNFEELFFPGAARPFVIEQDRLSGRLVEKQIASSSVGDFFEATLTCTVRGISLDREYLRRKLMNKRVHVLATYQDDLQRFIPRMRLTSDGDSGDRSTRNGYTFSGTARYLTPAPTINSALTPPIGSGGGGSSSDAMTPVIINGVTGSTYTYTIPAGHLLLGIYVKSTAAQTVDIGTTAGDSDISEDLGLNSNEYGIAGTMMLHADMDLPIYFSNLAGTNKIILYLVQDDPS